MANEKIAFLITFYSKQKAKFFYNKKDQEKFFILDIFFNKNGNNKIKFFNIKNKLINQI